MLRTRVLSKCDNHLAMATRKIIDVSDNEELRKLAEEVAATGESVVLSVGKKEVALITPGPPIIKPAGKTREEVERFLNSFGAWEGLIDAEEFKNKIRQSRSISKPAPDL
jgi:hypothetical protein